MTGELNPKPLSNYQPAGYAVELACLVFNPLMHKVAKTVT